MIHHNTIATVASSDAHKSVPDDLVSFEKFAKQTSFCLFFCFLVTVSSSDKVNTGAIVVDEGRKGIPFLILGLSLLYETMFLFLEQIAPSPVAHARTCCEDYCGYRAGKIACDIPEIFL